MAVHEIVNGIVQVTGEHDVGKTTFALDAIADPGRAVFFDSDVKGRATVEQLLASGVRLGMYQDLIEIERRKPGDELAFHANVMSIIDTIKPGEFDILIWDTFRRFEKTFIPVVEANPQAYRKVWSNQPAIRAKERKSEGVELTAQFLNRLQSLFRLVIICTHLRDEYAGEVRTGKLVPDNNRTLERVCRMRIWLRRNPYDGSPIPIGLLLKRLDVKVLTERGLRTVSVLPQRIVPNLDFTRGEIDPGIGDTSLWDTIMRYYQTPIGNRKPFTYETPDAYELSILEGTLTEDQRMTLRLAVAALEEERQAELIASNLAAQRARDLAAQQPGLMPPEIVNLLLSEIETGELDANPDTITVPAVIDWIRGV